MTKDITFLGDSITAWNNIKGIKNYGVPGYFTRDILWQLKDNESIKGETVVLMIGVNDILGDYSAQKIYQNIEEILNILRGRFKRILLVSVLPTMYINKNIHIKNLNFVLREQLFIENIEVCNLFLNEEGVIDNKYSSDGVHLSPLGYDLLNAKLKEIL